MNKGQNKNEMKKIKLKESDIQRIVKRVLNEGKENNRIRKV